MKKVLVSVIFAALALFSAPKSFSQITNIDGVWSFGGGYSTDAGRVIADCSRRLAHDDFPRRAVAYFDDINAGSESTVAYPAAFHVEYAHCAVLTAFHDDIAVQNLDGDILHV